MLDEKLLLPLKMVDEELVYSDWKLLGMDFLVTGKITNSSGSIEVIMKYMIFINKEKYAALRFLVFPTKFVSLVITPVMVFMSQ